MAWVVDTSVVVDLVTGDPLFAPESTACLQAHLGDGLVISLVRYTGDQWIPFGDKLWLVPLPALWAA